MTCRLCIRRRNRKKDKYIIKNKKGKPIKVERNEPMTEEVIEFLLKEFRGW